MPALRRERLSAGACGSQTRLHQAPTDHVEPNARARIMTEVINIKTTRLKMGQYVYIGRPMIWGNPFSHLPSMLARFKVTNRAEAIIKHEQWIREQPNLLLRLPELVGKKLGCHCRPLACHGDTLVKLIYERELA